MAEQPSRLVAFHQYAAPVAMLFLSLSAFVLAVSSGYALCFKEFEAASFVAVVGQFMGLLGLAYGQQRATSSRAADTPAAPTNGTGPGTETKTTATVTTTERTTP